MTRRREGRSKSRQRPLDARGDGGAAGNVPPDLLACRVDGAADLGHHERARKAREAGRKVIEHLVNGGKFAEFLRIAHEFDGTCLCARGATD